MKNILICRVAKSGKSYLSKKICQKYKYNHIPIDYFTSSFKHNYPEIGITSNIIIDKNSSKNLALFLSRIINIIDNNDDDLYILDSAHLYPEDIINYIDLNKWDIYFLGYPDTTVDKKFIEIRKYIHNGWPADKTDDKLKIIIKELINISKEIEKQCIIHNIKFINTSNFDNINHYFKKI